jgi:WS/DGAT/MGAT family acyltransferase
VGGRAAVLGKVHHAMVDGIAAVQLGLLLFDVDPDAPAGEPEPWEPAPRNPLDLAVDAARDSALTQFRTARQAAGLGLSPGRGMRVADTVRRAAFSLAEDALNPAPDSYLNPEITARRRLVGTMVSLARLNAIKHRTETKLNDVVLALVAGALARLAHAHGRQPEDLRVMVPANVRTEANGDGGNAISFLFVDLPVATAQPPERPRLIHERTRALKQEDRIAGTDGLLQMLGHLPAPIQGPAARLAASPRMYNLTVSNVPGPAFPLYVAGGRVRSILPVIPIPDRHAIAIGALTYNDQVHVAAYIDPGALPRGGRLPVMIADALEELDMGTGRQADVAA